MAIDEREDKRIPEAGVNRQGGNAMPRAGAFPLSFAQQRLWFMEQLEPGNEAYNVPMAVRLRGSLSVEVLNAALVEVVRRHDILRTRFEVQEGQGLQVIDAPPQSILEIEDLSGLEEAAREQLVHKQASEEAVRPFDLTAGPVLRTRLFILTEDEYVLLLTMHHIVTDGWSMGVFMKEVCAFYEALQRGGKSGLRELPVQYVDYAVWQRERLQGEVLEKQLEYWRQRLAGLPVLELPTDRIRSAVRSRRGASVPVRLSDELYARLKATIREEGVTLFMVLLASFQTLLAFYSGQYDLAVGTDVANRDHEEIEGLIGFFVNQVVLRSDLSGNPSVKELLRRVRAVCLGAYAHQELPFERLVEELNPERNLNRSPLFQVKLVLQNMPWDTSSLAGVSVSPIAQTTTTAKFDLTLTIEESGDGLIGECEYATDLFESTTVEWMMEHWKRLLEQMAVDPKRRLSELEMLGEEERRQVLVEWNRTDTEYPRDRQVQELFEEQVEKTPEAVAVVFGREVLNYEGLNRKANQLAHYLRRAGVGPEVLVAVCMQRSIEMVVGLLGILKAGGAYVPVDSEYPSERLRYILENAHVKVLLTQSLLSGRLPGTKAQIVELDRDWDAIERECGKNLALASSPQNLAYVIYTSGSTGRPKGVGVTHMGLQNHMCWMQRACRLTPAERVLQKTSFSFDASVWEFFWPLLSGARLVLARPEAQRDPTALMQDIVVHGITTLQVVPSLLRALTQQQVLRECNTLTRIFVGGEVLPSQLVKATLKQASVVLTNLYGPTETTIDATFFEANQALEGQRVPIGRPIANTQVYVLDECMKPLPAGIVGEVYIGGAGLARGYLKSPELTAEKFVPNPFSRLGGERLYRSEDKGRWRRDGVLEFLGRVDGQAKIRGYRVEPGEIEAALREHVEIRDAVVAVKEEQPGQNRLVAYLVTREGAELKVAQLREHLEGRLPEYMVPSAFVFLEALPLTPNGKVDRRNLPILEEIRFDLQSERPYVAPRTPVEAILAGIWRKILQIQKVGVTDNFFELGGHSLSAITLAAEIRDQFGTNVPIKAIFTETTIERLAVIVDHPKRTTKSQLVALQPYGSRRPFFCVHPGGGLVHSYVSLAHAIGSQRPFYAFQAVGIDDGEEPHDTIEAMAAHYITELQKVQPQGPYLIGGWSFGGIVAYEMAQQLSTRGNDVPLIALFDSSLQQDAPIRLGGEGHADQTDETEYLGHILASYIPDALQTVTQRKPQERFNVMIQLAKEAGILPREFDDEMVRRVVKVFGANERARSLYEPHQYDGRVVLFRAQEEASNGIEGHSAGWDRFVSGPLEICVVPGTHTTMMKPPNVQSLAERLSGHLTLAGATTQSMLVPDGGYFRQGIN